jgi:hypothetical protein
MSVHEPFHDTHRIARKIPGGAGGTRTHDRRIMSPVRQQVPLCLLTWANADDRDAAQPDFGAYLTWSTACCVLAGARPLTSVTPGPRTATEQAQGRSCVPEGVARWIDACADRIARHSQGRADHYSCLPCSSRISLTAASMRSIIPRSCRTSWRLHTPLVISVSAARFALASASMEGGSRRSCTDDTVDSTSTICPVCRARSCLTSS